MSDLSIYARKLAAKLTAGWFARRADKQTAANKLIEFAADLERQAGQMAELETWLDAARERGDDLEDKLRNLRRMDARIKQALVDFKHPSASNEKPVAAAVILSPYQFDNFPIRSFEGLPVLIAAGVCGPVVVSKKALDGISRQAPELNLKAV